MFASFYTIVYLVLWHRILSYHTNNILTSISFILLHLLILWHAFNIHIVNPIHFIFSLFLPFRDLWSLDLKTNTWAEIKSKPWFLILFLSLSLSISISSLSDFFSLSIPVPIHLYLSLSLSPFLFFSISLSPDFSLTLSITLCFLFFHIFFFYKAVGDVPTARSGHRMIVWRNYILLFGGFYEALREVRTTVNYIISVCTNVRTRYITSWLILHETIKYDSHDMTWYDMTWHDMTSNYIYYALYSIMLYHFLSDNLTLIHFFITIYSW